MYLIQANASTRGHSQTLSVRRHFRAARLAVAADGAQALVLLLWLLLSIAPPVLAQTETVIHEFSPINGQYPSSRLTSDAAGNLYGTTTYGGFGRGTVFELSPDGNGGWNETVLYNFCSVPNCADGINPYFSDVIIDRSGNLYGTAEFGGTNDTGVVYELSPNGAGWTETVLHNFGPPGGADGSVPIYGLIMDSAGNLYGRTASGGGCGCGTVFEMIPSGGDWSEKVIYTTYGDSSYTGLAMDSVGNIFGATTSTVFELSPNDGGSWTPKVIHNFVGAPKDGDFTVGTPVLDQSGSLYGATFYGGTKNFGTVYKLSPGKKGKWTKKIVHSFQGGKDGYGPNAGVVLDSFGNLYGTTTYGGRYVDGTVFELVARSGKSYQKKVLWNFSDGDGKYPIASLTLDSAGNLYGTTSYGGFLEDGLVFEVTR